VKPSISKLRTAERLGLTAALLPPEAAEYGEQILA